MTNPIGELLQPIRNLFRSRITPFSLVSVFTCIRFQTKTNIYQLVFTLVFTNASNFLVVESETFKIFLIFSLLLPFSNSSIFGVRIAIMSFGLAPFPFISIFIVVFI